MRILTSNISSLKINLNGFSLNSDNLKITELCRGFGDVVCKEEFVGLSTFYIENLNPLIQDQSLLLSIEGDYPILFYAFVAVI